MSPEGFPMGFPWEECERVPSVLPFDPLQERCHAVLAQTCHTGKITLRIIPCPITVAIPTDAWG